jgi:hypothetical protein
MKPSPDPGYRHRFPAEIIGHAVWLYHVFSLSPRDVELLPAERGIVVSHESIRQWCKKFGQVFAGRLRHRRPRPGDKWHMHEVFIRIGVVQQLSLARGGSGRRGVGDPCSATARRQRGQTILSPAAERPSICAARDRHRQAAKLRRGTPPIASQGRTPAKPISEQPRGKLTSANTTTRAADATVQIT